MTESFTEQEVEKLKTLIDDTIEDIDNNNFDLASFSKGLMRGYQVYATPQMVNTNLQNINLNPQVGKYKDYLAAIESPKTNEDKLISYGQHEYLSSMLYKRNFDYYANLLAFNLSIVPKNARREDYNSPAYKKDWRVLEDFLDKFDYKTEFTKCVFNMLNADLYPCLFRKDMSEDKFVLQDFPYKYAKITGRFSHGLVCDYDLTFLMNGTQDLRMYPKWLQRKYSDLTKNKSYVPSANINNRTGNFAYWVQTSPEDGAWAFKLNPDFITEIPYFTPMILDTGLTDLYRTLQMNQSVASARKIITSQWPLLTDRKTSQADALAVRGETMGELMTACMAGLNKNGDLFNIMALPSDKIEVHQMENKNAEQYQEFLKTISGLLGGANTLFSTQKQTSTETLVSCDIDKMFMEKVYPQFENFLSYYINKITRKFKFDFKFSGTKSYINKEARIKEAFDAAKVGIVSLNKIANAFDMDQIEFKRELEMTKESGIGDLFMPLLNIYTASSGKSSDGGRPQKSSGEISESGEASRDAGTNIDRGGQI